MPRSEFRLDEKLLFCFMYGWEGGIFPLAIHNENFFNRIRRVSGYNKKNSLDNVTHNIFLLSIL